MEMGHTAQCRHPTGEGIAKGAVKCQQGKRREKDACMGLLGRRRHVVFEIADVDNRMADHNNPFCKDYKERLCLNRFVIFL